MSTGSIFINFVLRVYATLNHFYEKSILYKLIVKITKLCNESIIASSFYNFLCVKGKNQYSEGSAFFKLLSFVLNKIFIIFEKLYSFLYTNFQGGFFHSITLSCTSFIKNNLRIISFALSIAIVASAFISLKISIIIVGATFAIFTFFNLPIAICFFIVGMSIVPHSLWNNMYIFLASIFFAGVFFMQIISGKRATTLKSTFSNPMFPCLIVYTLMIILSLFTSRDFSDSLRISLILFSCIIFTVLILNVINSKELLITFVKFLIFAGFLTSVYGIFRYALGLEVRVDFIDTSMNGGLTRLYSTMDNPNNFAEFLILLIPVAVSFIFICKTDFKRLFFALLIIPCFLALVLTLSRAAYIAIVISFIIFVWLVNKRLLPFLAVFAVFAIPFIPLSIIDRIMTIGRDSSSEFRLFIWEGSYHTLIRNWFYGVGIGPVAFGKVFKIYVNPVAAPAMHSHNLLLQIWLETGIGGFISFIVLCFASFKSSVVNIINTDDFEYKFILCGLATSIPAILCFGMVEHVWFYPRIMLTFWIIMGVLGAAIGLSKNSKGGTCS